MTNNDTKPSQERAETTRPRFVVGIGASAGGLAALELFFENMPTDSGLAFVVIQHLSPDYKSRMDELLSRKTAMPAHKVDGDTLVEPNSIYLIPPKKNMVIRQGQLLLTEQDSQASPNLPIDIFFQSLAQDVGERAIAIVLSGTGSDGSRGIRLVHDAGGLVLVQDTDSSAFDGMPKSAAATKLADVVTSPDAMPDWINRYILQPSAFPRGEASQIEERGPGLTEDPEKAEIFRIFRQEFGIDFSYYRPTTIARRLERRVQLSGCRDLKEYLKRLGDTPREVDTLYRDLLVEVTHFFRDRESFQKLRELVPDLIKQAHPRGEVRVWVPGCATGEEAYSYAMLLDDCAAELNSEVDIKVFATDVHPTSLETASTGVYSATSVSAVPDEYNERYFQQVGELYHVRRELRQYVIFAPHDITKDPPFTRIDLLSCRNVLIYLEPAVQKKVLSLFHFGMKVGGTLVLGPSETLSQLENEFECVDRHWKIFEKLRNVRLPQTNEVSMSTPITRTITSRASFVSTATRTERNWLIPEAHEQLLHRYAPPSLLVNEHHEVVHSFGEARTLLMQPGGRVTLDVTKMVSSQMSNALVAALHKANTIKDPVVFKDISAETTDGVKRFHVKVERFRNSPEKTFLICFEPSVDPPPPVLPEDGEYDPTDMTSERIALLERELAYTKETLQATVEELETSNEELQSTNEELVASNEELQSTNEELHSVNEELHTVNSEHQRKIAELTQLADDMDNLLSNSHFGTLFLDRDFRIRRFTPAIQGVLHIMEQDEGRPIEHIAHTFGELDLMELVRPSFHEKRTIKRDAKSRDGKSFIIETHPYISDGVTVGVVLTCYRLDEDSATDSEEAT